MKKWMIISISQHLLLLEIYNNGVYKRTCTCFSSLKYLKCYLELLHFSKHSFKLMTIFIAYFYANPYILMLSKLPFITLCIYFLSNTNNLYYGYNFPLMNLSSKTSGYRNSLLYRVIKYSKFQ